MSYYRIYAKTKHDKRFMALDVANGIQVANLIYASVYTNELDANQVVNELISQNKDIQFKYKKA